MSSAIAIRVLVADDDDACRSALRQTFAAMGCVVLEAMDGVSALERLAACADGHEPMPALIVLDVCMPGLSGLGVLSMLRRFGARVPTFIVTGFEDPSVDLLAARHGAARVFHKPLDLDELVAAAREVLPLL